MAHNAKGNSRKKGVSAERRRQRQEEAEERKAIRALRTPDEQLAALRERGIFSGREHDRLTALVENGQGKLKTKRKGKD